MPRIKITSRSHGLFAKGATTEGEFAITAHDGKTWELHSTSIKLDNHLGHTVTVTGPRTQETKAQEKAEAKREGLVQASSKEVYSELAVTGLKMVSETCK